MKFQSFLSIAAICLIAFFSSCKNESSTAKGVPADNTGAQSAPGATSVDPAAAPAPTPSPTPEPAQNAAGVWHYTCPKGCAGGAGSAAACPKCGTMLAHNQTYHGAASPAGAPGQTATMPNTQKPPEPAQNAAGVWHYTCASGCAGGAGSAVPCPKCGKTLAHNSAYHQQ